MKEKQLVKPTQHGFTKQRSCLTNPIAFYNEMTSSVAEERAVDVVYLVFKISDTASHNIPINKLVKFGLRKSGEPVGSKGCDQQHDVRLEANHWWCTSGGDTKANINAVINDLDDGTECSLIKFANDTKLGEAVDTLESHAAVRKDLVRLDQWADRNFVKSNKEKC